MGSKGTVPKIERFAPIFPVYSGKLELEIGRPKVQQSLCINIMSRAFLRRRRLGLGRSYKIAAMGVRSLSGRRTQYGASRRRAQAAWRVASVVPGFTRTSGFYGRYRGGPGTSGTVELKFHDVDLDDAVVAATGGITDSICKIPQGTTEITRIGRKCTITNINWHFQVQLPAGTSTGGTADTVRVILYLDKQCNGAAATITGILESADFQSFNNLGNKSRFKTLMDRDYNLNTNLSGDGTTVDSGLLLHNDSFYKKCNIPIEFDAVAGAITEIRSNNLGVLLISSQGIAGFVSKFRLRFSDL